MEESAVAGKIRLKYRLLVLLTLLTAANAICKTQGIPNGEIVQPEASWFFTGSESSFLLRLPDVAPSDVAVSVPKQPDGVRFISSYKDEFVLNGERGTSIRLWFTFSKAGEIRLPDLRVEIAGKKRSIPFASATIYENPSLLKPQLLVRYESANGEPIVPTKSGNATVRVAETVFIHLSVLYAAHVSQVNWQLPENALFSEVERYAIAEGNPGSNAFSPEAEPVALFEWVPLETDTYQPPNVSITAVSYNGQRTELMMPAVHFNVTATAKVNSQGSANIPEALEDAFRSTLPKSTANTTRLGKSDKETALSLAQLRAKERISLPFSSATENRMAFERQQGLGKSTSERSFLVVGTLLVLALLCTILLLFFAFTRRKEKLVFFAIATFVLVGGAILYGLPLANDTGIFTGGVARVVPELNAGGTIPIAPCTRVRILERTGNWLYIDSNGNGGWVPQESVVEISLRILKADEETGETKETEL